MAEVQKPVSFLGLFISILITAIIVGLSYWIWQDIKPLLRPFKGDVWALLKDLRILVNIMALFAVLTIVGYVVDRSGSASFITRIVMFAVMLVVVGVLIRNGTFFKKEIEPTLQTIGFERPGFLKPGK